MKKKLFLTLSLLGCLYTALPSNAQVFVVDTNSIFNQDSIDTQRIKVQYEMTYLQDTVSEDAKPGQETLMLEIGKQYSKCYSYNFYVRDSLLIADAQAGASKETMLQHATAIGNSRISYQIFKHYPTGKVTTLDRLATTNFLCEEKEEMPEWRFSSIQPPFFLIPVRKLLATLKAETIQPGIPWKFQFRKGPGNYTDCQD